jgi:hypothetical protein
MNSTRNNTLPSGEKSLGLYSVCDLLLAGILGTFIASTVPVLLGQSLPMFPGMLLAMVLGMILATPLTILAAIALGMFETMTYGMWTGMLAGMVGVMDTGSALVKLKAGLSSGVAVWFFFSLLNVHYRSKGAQLLEFMKESDKNVPTGNQWSSTGEGFRWKPSIQGSKWELI